VAAAALTVTDSLLERNRAEGGDGSIPQGGAIAVFAHSAWADVSAGVVVGEDHVVDNDCDADDDTGDDACDGTGDGAGGDAGDDDAGDDAGDDDGGDHDDDVGDDAGDDDGDNDVMMVLMMRLHLQQSTESNAEIFVLIASTQNHSFFDIFAAQHSRDVFVLSFFHEK
jgi:hypothetical protein